MKIYLLIESKEYLYDDRTFKTNLEAFVCPVAANLELQKLEASKETSYSYRLIYYVESVYLNQQSF